MVTIMAKKKINCANIIIQITFKEGQSVTCLIQVYNNTNYGHRCYCYGHPWVLAD